MIRMPPEHAAEFASLRNCSRKTMPSHIWVYTVELFAIRAGVPADVVREWHPHTVRSGAEGEPVWMAVDTLVQYRDARRLALLQEEQTPGEHLRAAFRTCGAQWPEK